MRALRKPSEPRQAKSLSLSTPTTQSATEPARRSIRTSNEPQKPLDWMGILHRTVHARRMQWITIGNTDWQKHKKSWGTDSPAQL